MTNLARMMKCYRTLEEIDQRTMGKRLGVSAATICRIEAGRLCDVPTIIGLMMWLILPVSETKTGER